MIVECEFQVSVLCGQRKVPVTSAHEQHRLAPVTYGLSIVYATSRRTGVNETKAYPTAHTPIVNANRGYPKQKRLSAMTVWV